jgi:hypothetical protein
MFNREYAVPYTSTSKGESFAIQDETKFNDFHLCAAVQKMKRQIVADGVREHDLDVFEALCRECGYRDLNPAYKGGKDPQDPRVPVRPGGDDEPTPSAPWGDE